MRCTSYILSLFLSLTLERPFEMSLEQRFNNAVSGATVIVSSLFQDKRYTVLHVERVETRFGPRVRAALRVEDGDIVKVFLPQRYGNRFEEADMVAINTRLTQYDLVYKGKCSVSGALILQVLH
jgi:hypothetical protein